LAVGRCCAISGLIAVADRLSAKFAESTSRD
jgi:hypothetical protein